MTPLMAAARLQTSSAQIALAVSFTPSVSLQVFNFHCPVSYHLSSCHMMLRIARAESSWQASKKLGTTERCTKETP